MASFYENNCSAHWSYSPYSYGHSFETSSSTSSSFVESPMASSSPRAMMMMMPIYDQQPTPHCYYYSEPPIYHHSYTPPPSSSTYIATPMPCVTSPSTVVRPSTNLPNRLQYTGRQRWLLNEIYQHVPYPNSVQKNVIADRVGATREQIRIWFQNRRRLAVQGHRAAAAQRSNALPVDNSHRVQLELEEILLDLDVHKNAPQRMPVGQGASSRVTRRGRAQRK